MPETVKRGKLISVEGNGPAVQTEAKKLLRSLKSAKIAGGISSWDASNVFFELRHADPSLPRPTARVLMLLYAADLTFRLRWEIEPALAEGQSVIVASYIETPIALGRAMGLPRKWLVELFSFAPKGDLCYRVASDIEGAPWMGKSSSSFVEISCNMLSNTPGWNSPQVRRKFEEALQALEHRGICKQLTDEIFARAAEQR